MGQVVALGLGLGHGCVTRGAWRVVCGVWCVVCGVWCVVQRLCISSSSSSVQPSRVLRTLRSDAACAV